MKVFGKNSELCGFHVQRVNRKEHNSPLNCWAFMLLHCIIIDDVYMIAGDKTPKISDFHFVLRSPQLHCIFVFKKIQLSSVTCSLTELVCVVTRNNYITALKK